jgi:hypothetical protein
MSVRVIARERVTYERGGGVGVGVVDHEAVFLGGVGGGLIGLFDHGHDGQVDVGAHHERNEETGP